MGKRRKGEIIIHHTANHHAKPIWTYLGRTEGSVLLHKLLTYKGMWHFSSLTIQLSVHAYTWQLWMTRDRMKLQPLNSDYSSHQIFFLTGKRQKRFLITMTAAGVLTFCASKILIYLTLQHIYRLRECRRTTHLCRKHDWASSGHWLPNICCSWRKKNDQFMLVM